MSRRRLRVAMAAGVLLGAFAGGWRIARSDPRVRHLALPVWSAPDERVTPSQAVREGPACEVVTLARLPGRITALARGGDGTVWIGLFDGGVYRWDRSREAAPRLVGDAVGRERFVNALAVVRGEVLVGTNEGVLMLARDGARRRVVLDGEMVEALLADGAGVLAGTARGVYRVEPGPGGGVLPVAIVAPDGSPLRVTALAANGGSLVIGTPRGLFVTPLPPAPAAGLAGAGSAGAAEGEARARWIPLVFGTPPASTNVVTALAALAGGGVVAGTDDGGLALVTLDGAVRALPGDDPAANLINPGAACATTTGAVFGTQGGGLIRVRHPTAAGLILERPAHFPIAAVTAVVAASALDDGGALLASDAHGTLFSVRCPD